MADVPDEIHSKLDVTQGQDVQSHINISIFRSFASLLDFPGSQEPR